MISRFARQCAVIMALPAVLAGCASFYPQAPSTAPTTAAGQPARAYRDTIDLAGRLSVRYQGSQKEEALHGNFEWKQTPLQTGVTLLSPLGQTVAVIDVGPDGARLLQNGQAERKAADVNTLTAQTLGWPLPVGGLRDWLQGFVTTSDGRRVIATPQQSELTTNDGWQIRYANWQADTPAVDNRPKRIDLTRTTAQAGEVAIRIVIDSWQAH